VLAEKDNLYIRQQIIILKTIPAFQGEHRFLSNFWPCYIEYNDLVYPTLEHAYQAAKFADPAIKKKIQDCPTPADAKDWLELNNKKPDAGWTVEKKLSIMETLLMIKFGGKDPLLTRALLATDDAAIIEGNNWNDTFWGICDNTGENHLGKLLMKVRTELFRQKQHIILELEKQGGNTAVAKALSITPRILYEKMIAFSIKNKEYWIS
jgi:N-glycosidase YbiA